MHCALFGYNVDNQLKHFKKGSVKFFRFPTDTLILKAWLDALRISHKDHFITAKSNTRVSSKHFKETDYKRSLNCVLLGYASIYCDIFQ